MDTMWITVENTRVFGDFSLGISKVLVKGSHKLFAFPQPSPQVLTSTFFKKVTLVRKEICNYKKVIPLTHLFTSVITTNFKYKTYLLGVRP